MAVSQTVTDFPLIDGPLPIAFRPRKVVVEEMAAILVKYDSFRNEADAIRCLLALRVYSSFEVLRYIDDVRQYAMQQIVAREMSEAVSDCQRPEGER